MAASSCSPKRRAFAEAARVEVLSARHPAFEQSNSLVILDEKLVLKCYRRLRQGINPEIEIGRYLTDVSPYPNIAPVLGALQFLDDAGQPTALAVLQRYVHNQGSGWNYVIEYLRRYLDQQLTVPPDEADAAAAANAAATGADSATASPAIAPAPGPSVARGASAAGAAVVSAGTPTPHASFLTLVAMLGQRTGELHVALAATSGDPAFDPEPVSTDDVAAWIAAVVAEVDQTLRSGLAATGRSSAARARGGRATARHACELKGPHRRARTSRPDVHQNPFSRRLPSGPAAGGRA